MHFVPTCPFLSQSCCYQIGITAIDYAYHGLEAARSALQCAFNGISTFGLNFLCRGRICWRWLTFPKFYVGISTQGRSKYCTKRMVPEEPSGNKNKIQFWHGTVPPALGDPRMELREQQLTKRFIKSSPPSANYTSRKRTGACCHVGIERENATLIKF